MKTKAGVEAGRALYRLIIEELLEKQVISLVEFREKHPEYSPDRLSQMCRLLVSRELIARVVDPISGKQLKGRYRVLPWKKKVLRRLLVESDYGSRSESPRPRLATYYTKDKNHEY